MGDKKNAKAEKIIVDNIDTSEMKYSKLQEFAQSLLQKLNATRKDRKCLQVQCSQLKTAWKISRSKMQECENRIKMTALNRDKKEHEISGKIIKRIDEEKKYTKFVLMLRTSEMRLETANILKDLDNKWDQSTLQNLSDQKTALKLKWDQDFEDLNISKHIFQEKLDAKLENLIKTMENETEKILDDITACMKKNEQHLRLLSDTAFFRTQEEYNKIITELVENGQTNTGMLREFYKRITEDDIILIMVLEKQIKKLEKTVRKKQISCKKIYEHIKDIEPSRGEIEVSLGRTKRKMKLYESNTLALTRAKYSCDKMQEKKNANAIDYKDMIHKENFLTERVNIMEKYIQTFYEIVLSRQKEVFEPLQGKIKILNELIKRDKKQMTSILHQLPIEIKHDTIIKLSSTEALADDCMTCIISVMASLCSTHDNLIDFIERGLDKISTKVNKLNFKRINFDTTTYGLGPAGELITKYP